ncbi:hypothetical protein, partial [Rhodovulum sulfidophilum]|uniref:hypothetical protein n=1 Tax=Rhodovulum sulfidophilum TaxID=35806 RepID=UPI00138A2427
MAFPPDAVRVASLTLKQITSSLRVQSPYSFAQTAYDFMGGMWAAELVLAAFDARESAAISGWIASLNGPAGSFELDMAAMEYDGPHGAISADPVVAVAANARAQALVLQLARAGDRVLPGDYLTLGRHLHIVTAAEAPTPAFRQSVTLWPRLRRPVATLAEAPGFAGAATGCSAAGGVLAMAPGATRARYAFAGRIDLGAVQPVR